MATRYYFRILRASFIIELEPTPARTLVISNTLIPANGSFLFTGLAVAFPRHRVEGLTVVKAPEGTRALLIADSVSFRAER